MTSSSSPSRPLTDEPALSDEDLLDGLQRAAFEYFRSAYNPANGLVADRSSAGSPCSIAAVGFALSSYPVAVERGWMTRDEAVERTLVTLQFFLNSPQSEAPDATGYKGLYYHFLDMKSGRRIWRCELSLIDTALLIAGILTASTYFADSNPSETEIRRIADVLYRRVDWCWAQNGKATLSQGWKPECGFLHYGWEGYSEASILYVLAIASPTYPIPKTSYHAWTSTYQWENLYGHDFLYAAPLFIHQFSHAWIDFRGIQDPFMREKRSDYFENSRQATYIQREYALRNPHGFRGYGENFWGLSAGDGPEPRIVKVDGQSHRLFGYAARGVPYGPDDGTIVPAATLASIVFAPEITLAAMRHFREQYPEAVKEFRLPSAINPTLAGDGSRCWTTEAYVGLDQGTIVLMIENYRSELIWKLMRQCPYIGAGLRSAEYRGGWL